MKQRIGQAVFGVLTVLGVAGCTASQSADSTAAPAAGAEIAVAANRDGCVSQEEFDALRTGMSFSDAVTILGDNGEKLSESDIADISTSMYQWVGCGTLGANMNAMFQNGELVQKTQFGLRSTGTAAVMPTTTTTSRAPTSAEILADAVKLERAIAFVSGGDCRTLEISHDVAIGMVKNPDPFGSGDSPAELQATRKLGALYRDAIATRMRERGC